MEYDHSRIASAIAEVMTNTQCCSASREDFFWVDFLEDVSQIQPR
jgi:hypothetical protein